MKHLQEEQIWALIDNTLELSEKKMLEAHLQNCVECQTYYNEIKSFDFALSQNVVEEPSLRFSKNVMDIIEEEVSLKFKPLVNRMWQKIFATSLGSGILAIFLLGTISPSSVKVLPSFLQNIPVQLNNINQLTSFIQHPIFLISTLSLLAFWALYAMDKLILETRL